MKAIPYILNLFFLMFLFSSCKKDRDFSNINRVSNLNVTLNAGEYSSTLGPGTTKDLAIDVDKNGVDDIKFVASHYSTASSSGTTHYIEASFFDGYEVFVDRAPFVTRNYVGTQYEYQSTSYVNSPKQFSVGDTIVVDSPTSLGTLPLTSYRDNNNARKDYLDFWRGQHKTLAFINRQRKVLAYIKVKVIYYDHIVIERLVVKSYSRNLLVD